MRQTAGGLRQLFLIILCGAVLGLGGCGPEASNSPTPTVQTTPAADTLLWEDTFTQVPSGWGTWNRNGSFIKYDQGGLRILVNDTNFDYWSVAGQKFRDASIRAVAKRLAGPEDNDFGLVCRFQNNQNFYMFLVSSDGYYGIAKLKNNQHSLIGIEQLQYSQQIKKGQAAHKLRADCVGDTLRLFVDDQQLLEAHDSDFQNGDVGVLAGAYSSAGVDILFDDFEVRQP